MRRPNFFIIGAPKSGTTSLANYLGEHPEIFFPKYKEPHFFNTDMAFRSTDSEAAYYENFRDAQPGHIAVGEGSVLYLYSSAAVPNIMESLPDARFIVLVRNPVDMAMSYHAQMRYGGDEDIDDFSTAWRMQEFRKRGEKISAFCRDPSLLLYGKICSLGWQLTRLYKRVPRERVLVLFQDDLKDDARRIYLRTLEFLGVPDDGRKIFGIYNERRPAMRSHLVQVAIRTLSGLKMRSGAKGTLGILALVQRLNQKTVRNDGRDQQLNSELANYFREDIEKLSALVDRDLTGWLRA